MLDRGTPQFSILRAHGKVALFAIRLMTSFNFFSHGTQGLYTTFPRVQHGFDPLTVKNVLVIGNIGAIIGGLFFGSFSQGFGRRKTIILVTLLALPVIYFWRTAQRRWRWCWARGGEQSAAVIHRCANRRQLRLGAGDRRHLCGASDRHAHLAGAGSAQCGNGTAHRSGFGIVERSCANSSLP
jgi:hypothetical protein